ncbi:MAG: hypothetical protein ABUT20_41205 [Bacteroidota bacterium]
MSEELLHRLTKSEAVSSLTMERGICETMSANGWRAIRSPYYRDKETDKYKEIDIIASWSYEGLYRRKVPLLTELSLLIECKSISGYHIIVDGEVAKRPMERETLQHTWWGYDLDHSPSRLETIFEKSTLNATIKAQAVKSLQHILYPNDRMLYYKAVPDPLPIPRFPTFREMNIGSTKDLDNSVLWKAFMSLNSAAESFGHRHWKRINEELPYYCNHKILVIDAEIWKVGQPITPLPYFRFLQRNIYGYLTQWIDVVNMKHIEAYSKQLTDHYQKFYNKTNLWKKD